MDKRRTILCVLLGLALVYHALIIHQIFFSSAFMAEIMSGMLPAYAPEGVGISGIRNTGVFGDAGFSRLVPLRPGDWVVKVSTTRPAAPDTLIPYQNMVEYGADISRWKYGERLFAVVYRGFPSSRRVVLEIPPPGVPTPGWQAKLGVFLIFELIPLGFLATAFVFGFQRAENAHAWLACLTFYTFPAIIFFTFSTLPPAWMAFAYGYRYIVSTFIYYLMLRFFLNFPQPSPLKRLLPSLLPVVFALSVVYGLIRVVFTMQTVGLSLDTAWSQFLLTCQTNMFRGFLFLPLVGLVSLTLNTFRAEGRGDRRRMAILWAGSLVSLGAFMSSIISRYFFYTTPSVATTTAVIFCMGTMPLAFLYVALRHRPPGIGLVLRGGIRYLLASRGFLVLESAALLILFAFYVGPAVEDLFPATDRRLVHAVFLAAALSVAFGLNRMNPWIMNRIDRMFFREAYSARKVFGDLGKAIRGMVDHPDRLSITVAETVRDALHLESVRVFLPPGNSLELGGVSAGNTAGGPWRCACYAASAGGAWRTPAASGSAGSEFVLAADGEVARRLLASPEEDDAMDVQPINVSGRAGHSGSSHSSSTGEIGRLRDLGVRLLTPLSGPGGLLGFMALGEKLSEEPFTREDRDLLATVAEQAALALDYSRLMRQAMERERLRREIEIARDVQERLFPQLLPPMANLEYAGACRPAGGVGGDYYDFVFLGQGRIGIALGDISGKGISAALLMAGLQGMLRVSAPLRGDALVPLMGELNAGLAASTSGDRFATFFYALWDDAHRRLLYVNAGHNPPFRLAAVGGKPEFLDKGGTVLGIFHDAAFESGDAVFGAGDVLVLYSDGVTEAVDTAGEEFGIGRLVESIRGRSGVPVGRLIRDVLDEVHVFAGDAPQHDDMTLVVARVR